MAKSKTRKLPKRRRKPVSTGYAPVEVTVGPGVVWPRLSFDDAAPKTVTVEMTPEQMRRVMLALLGS